MKALAVLAASWAVVGPVELRGGAVIDAPIGDISLAGVRIGGDEPRIIAWDHIKLVTGDRAEDAEPYMRHADMAWRARLRLARGDADLARPLFEELFEAYRSVSGPTALLVAEGALTCRLRRGDQGPACDAWLMALALRRDGVVLDGEQSGESDPHMLRTLVDVQTGLTPALPPILLRADALALLGATSATADDDPTVVAMVAMYRRAAALQCGAEAGAPPDLAPEVAAVPGVSLVRDMSLALDPDAAVRAPARQRLIDGLGAAMGAWGEAWARAAIGRSLLLEDDPAQRLRGVLHLLHVPARFARSQAYLAGACEAWAAIELANLGRMEEAAAIESSLRAREPRHPALALFAAEPPPAEGEEDTGRGEPPPETPTDPEGAADDAH